jgi:protein-S-isoprenylcysteine O-methyltransferase Ste14
MLAFLGVAIAFPSPIISSVCLLNIGLFLYMAFDDERVLLASAVAADYRSYKTRARMFLPRFG